MNKAALLFLIITAMVCICLIKFPNITTENNKNNLRLLYERNTDHERTDIQNYKYISKEHFLYFLYIQLQTLEEMNLCIYVNDRLEMLPYAFQDFKALDPNLPDDEAQGLAENEIIGNQCSAFTTMDDKYISLQPGYIFDRTHEFVHILTARGGRSKLQQFKSDFNEGCINYYAEMVHQSDGLLQQRYPTQTDIVKRLVKFLGNAGEELLFKMVFKGEINEFFKALGEAYVNHPSNPNGTPKNKREKQFKLGGIEVNGSAAQEISTKITNWMIKWIIDRF
jgi:hypothetical protein